MRIINHFIISLLWRIVKAKPAENAYGKARTSRSPSRGAKTGQGAKPLAGWRGSAPPRRRPPGRSRKSAHAPFVNPRFAKQPSQPQRSRPFHRNHPAPTEQTVTPPSHNRIGADRLTATLRSPQPRWSQSSPRCGPFHSPFTTQPPPDTWPPCRCPAVFFKEVPSC